jgi:hypothetical protein
MTTKPRAKKEGTPAPQPSVEFDPPFAVKRKVIELLEEWLPRHTVSADAPEVQLYLNYLKDKINAL